MALWGGFHRAIYRLGDYFGASRYFGFERLISHLLGRRELDRFCDPGMLSVRFYKI